MLMWDVMNEPEDDAKWTDATRAYLRAALQLIKQLDAHHLTTVGLTWRIDRLATVGLPDVLQYHEYAPQGPAVPGRRRPRLPGCRQSTQGRRPTTSVAGRQIRHEHGAGPQAWGGGIHAGETSGTPGTEAEQARLFEIVLTAAEKERVAGILPWCLHDYPIQNPNESHFGLVRADGTLKPAALVLRDTFARWGNADPVADAPSQPGQPQPERCS